MEPVVEFIAGDISRPGLGASARVALGCGLAALAAGSALALGQDTFGLWTTAYVLPATAMLGPLLAAAWLVATPQVGGWRLYLILACLAAVLALSLVRPEVAGASSLGSIVDAHFWAAAAACFVRGLATSILAVVLLSTVLLRRLPLPTRRSQWATGLIASMVGVLMLNLHCQSADYRHIAFGHWGPAVPLTLLTLAAQRWWLRRRLTAALRANLASLRNLHGMSELR